VGLVKQQKANKKISINNYIQNDQNIDNNNRAVPNYHHHSINLEKSKAALNKEILAR
jgi:hypothetical protein